jgi:adenine phosphoribosyltransferase
MLQTFIRDLPDYPKPGVIYRDITPLLMNPKALEEAVNLMAEPFMGKGIQKVAAIEARGFIFGGAAALKLNAGFVPIRKKGKLPWRTDFQEYELEYGTGVIEVHADAFSPGESVLIVDDLLATGGTVAAAQKLIEKQGAIVKGMSFLIELDFLKGRSHLGNYPILSFIHY